jgi:hypothetical protein
MFDGSSFSGCSLDQMTEDLRYPLKQRPFPQRTKQSPA